MTSLLFLDTACQLPLFLGGPLSWASSHSDGKAKRVKMEGASPPKSYWSLSCSITSASDTAGQRQSRSYMQRGNTPSLDGRRDSLVMPRSPDTGRDD